MELPDSLKNIIIKQLASCDELTKNGERCGEKFIYSINEYLAGDSKEVKKIMKNCTKFCLTHLNDLFMNGELKLAYELENGDKNIVNLEKVFIKIKDKAGLALNYRYFDKKLYVIQFHFTTDDIDLDELSKKQSSEIDKIESHRYKIDFKDGIIPKIWISLIMDCFKYKKIDTIELEIVGEYDNDIPNIKNSLLILGNLEIGNPIFYKNSFVAKKIIKNS